ncbi:MAG: S-layer homology domain-containing protein [Chloroflexi bacterium]|nr:S-layer homology domain-containing protein [Chloroflexota bacterium]
MKSKLSFPLSALLILALLASFLPGSAATARAQTNDAPQLFSDAGSAQPAFKHAPSRSVVRSRYVAVNIGTLPSQDAIARKAGSGYEIELNLFPDVAYTGVIDRVAQYTPTSTSWTGTLKGRELSYFYLVVSNGTFIAHVASQDGIYEVSSAGNGVYRVTQIDQSKLPEKDDIRIPPASLLNNTVAPNSAALPDDGSVIDVMILYTPAARAAEGGTAAMDARVDLAITETNSSYTSSGVVPTMSLVYKGEISYVESGDEGTDLDRLTATSDGFIDTVHTLRDTYGADLVQLIVETGSGCGIAWFMSTVDASFASGGFSVVIRDCMTGNYSSGHEFGHNQSATHDTYVDTGTSPYPYIHGYVNLAARWRTVMAYNTQCADTAPGTYCTRLLYWSNPTKLYGGAAMGVTSSSENYKVLNNTAYTVANFRSATTPSLFADVPSTYWAADFIERLYNAGITGGCATGPLRYCPEASVTRAQMAIFILRGIHGSAYIPPAATGVVFSDVPAGYWAAAWIERLSAEGITGGCSGTSYCPEANITRAQMAIFLLRGKYGSAYVPPAATGTVFTDVPASYWAAAWIERLFAEGITSGCSGTSYCPDANVTRAQMAVFLVKTFSLP